MSEKATTYVVSGVAEEFTFQVRSDELCLNLSLASDKLAILRGT
jgi:hypothetical protein